MIRLPLIALVALIASAAALGCITTNDGASDTAPTPPPGSQPALRTGFDTASDANLRRLEREAEALAKTDGCTTVDQCRTAPVGSRPCGGPRYYLPYCRATTDSAALFAKLAELTRAENEYNQRNGLASTCEYRMPPEVELVTGSCRVKSPASR